MDASVALAALGAILTGTGGVVLVLYEFRRRDRRQLRGTLTQIDDDLYRLTEGYIDLRRYSFDLRRRLTDLGETTEPMPTVAPRDIEP